MLAFISSKHAKHNVQKKLIDFKSHMEPNVQR
jgi:hypothetical protein